MLSSVVFLLLCQYAVSNHDPLAHEFHEITKHYDDRLCQHLLSVDCSKHVVHGHSERLCGTDMVQYESFCVFAHVRCTNHTLSMLNKGECPKFTVGPTGMAATGDMLTTRDVLTTGDLLTTGDVVTTRDVLTTGDALTTRDVLTTAAVAPVQPTGVDPAFAVMKDVFCNNLHQITCGTVVTANICGNDGKIYNSQCMFSKTKCYKVDLEVAEASTCGDTGLPVKATPRA